MAMQDFADDQGIRPRVAEFLLKAAYYGTPPEVLETLNGMGDDELELLESITEKFQSSGGTAYYVLPFGVH